MSGQSDISLFNVSDDSLKNGKLIVSPAESSEESYQINFVLEDNEQKSSLYNSIFNFTNSIIGAGIMGLPYALNEAGFFFGIILLVVITWIVDWSVINLIKCGKLTSTNTYQDLVRSVLGKPGYWMITIFQIVFAFGGMCAYLVIVADTLGSVIAHYSNGVSRLTILTICTFLICLPLSSVKSMTHLAKTSFISLVAIAALVLTTIIEARKNSLPASDDKFAFIKPNFFQAIGVISFAFVCHHNTFIIYGSLRTPTLDRFEKVTHYSTGFSLLMSLLMAIPTYLAFTDSTKGNILNNFSFDLLSINIARLLFAFNILLTFPMECLVAREVIENFLFSDRPFNRIRHLLITFLLVLTSFLVSKLTCDLGIVLELTQGGFSAVLLAFILPPLCVIKLKKDRVFSYKNILPLAVLVFGIVTMILSTTLSIITALQPKKNRQQC
ncbi:hypothetical protein ROZALSC1DRAFT_30531 [Rozella allomycis CSF55]|uniref:Amino acid transporter transmembrane domain-containing protein n=1 Tax=Rozella allomycis (strain CSF55) TaxID=988480 RepID=A0A4V1IZD7_ROZAC|nr:hypothetical protein ROZALSC1DRAFT_30531 [Rozella allomycis CSF55]